MESFCLKCKQKREIKDPVEMELKSKGGSTRKAAKGTCPVCGITMFKFLKKAKEEPKKEVPEIGPETKKEAESFDETL